ncbi:MAG TPA: DUF3761 domain-containing protein [Gemmatimonadaceae bacterium]|nr:DUF3761 domain-containing protein [Gemmatimonadaceae bacterium]
MLSARNWLYAAGFALATSSLWAASANAQAASTICKDGTKSTASGRGACSGHGGVKAAAAKKATKAETKAAKTETKADAKVAKTETKADAKVAKTETKAATKTAKTATKAAKSEAKETKVAAAPAATKVGSGAADDDNPAGAIARCKDGKYSHAKSRRGACGHHGGVASWS